MVAYIKRKKIGLIKGRVITASKACGVGNVVGNKGGIQIHFKLNNRIYNFIGLHLLHGQDNREKRDEMMAEVLKSFRVERPELDPDMMADYCFIMGDMNYRFDTTFEEMMKDDKVKNAPELIPIYDQLAMSMKRKENGVNGLGGQEVGSKYPNYFEPKITFLPTYKRNMDDNQYKNKKDQAPSYCDRILFKNNTVFGFHVNLYKCIDDIFGSDHRPVYLSLVIKQSREQLQEEQPIATEHAALMR